MVKRAMLSIYDLTIVVLYVYQSGCLHEKNGGDECNTRPGCCFDFDVAACIIYKIKLLRPANVTFLKTG